VDYMEQFKQQLDTLQSTVGSIVTGVAILPERIASLQRVMEVELKHVNEAIKAAASSDDALSQRIGRVESAISVRFKEFENSTNNRIQKLETKASRFDGGWAFACAMGAVVVAIAAPIISHFWH